MKQVLKAVLVCVVVGAAVFMVWAVASRPDAPEPPRPLPDTAVMVHGVPTTCSELFGQPCDFGLQAAFNRWGTGLAAFVDSGVLGPYAERIGFLASAKLSLDACALSHTTGKTVLEFVEQAQRQHPDAGSPELFPFWNRTRQTLCPL
ncbi:hypothetical protein [Rhodococcus wratislaviensis]|uniref:Uncharacterized protein n=1 Tax=Rhodococcus wratislaviensis NBRC 100605 TaxID=1219028 RepID=X0PKR7_RHOWR|nr:hypothetical protein [Rhodococcus wratislaviensis]GAF42979.1 hypothetical protein RW1_005_00840 [Rhodococcus wratislaviensis NBRC 100605]